MKKLVSTRLYVENQGLRNRVGESLEQAYVQLKTDDEVVKTYTIEEFVAIEYNDPLWDALEKAGYDYDELSEEILHDPFIDGYISVQ